MSNAIIANMGEKIDKADSPIAVPVSATETAGFAKPPVVAVEATRVVAAVPFIVAAAPPPAMIASAQVMAGLISVNVEAMTNVPAIPASGTATVSKT